MLTFVLEMVSEDFIITQTEWVFKVDRELGLECLKKTGKEEPFKSEKILRFIKEQGKNTILINLGSIKACIKYLEYLTLEC